MLTLIFTIGILAAAYYLFKPVVEAETAGDITVEIIIIVAAALISLAVLGKVAEIIMQSITGVN